MKHLPTLKYIKHMKPRQILLLTMVIIVALIVFFAYQLKKNRSTNPVAQRGSDRCKQIAKDNESRLQENQILYVDSCFFPNPLKIKAGESVIFTNNSDQPMWIISDNSHGSKKLQLINFNSSQAWKKGESYGYKFEKAGRYSFHNNEKTGDKGMVIVE